MNDGPCHICGEPTCSLAGNPGLWPLLFPADDATGKCRHWHTGCVIKAMGEAARLRAALREIERLSVCLVRVVSGEALISYQTTKEMT